jgi:hypothetical protein
VRSGSTAVRSGRAQRRGETHTEQVLTEQRLADGDHPVAGDRFSK